MTAAANEISLAALLAATKPAPKCAELPGKCAVRAPNIAKPKPPTESQEQSAFVSWWRANYADLGVPSPLLLIASQAGAMLGGGNDRMRFGRFNKLKREGFLSGVPDLLVAVPRGSWHGLWLEMKRTKGGKVSPEQEAMHAALRSQSYLVAVCAGADAAQLSTEMYLTGQIKIP